MARNQMHLVENVAPAGRVSRFPKHSFRIDHVPYAIAPWAIAPVLPGETLESFYFEAREVSHPIKSSIIGAKTEYWLFYVKLRDLPLRDQIEAMFVDPANANFNAYDTAASVDFYHTNATRPNWTLECYKRIVEAWFRDAGGAWNSNLIGNYAAAQIKDQGWLDSLRRYS